MKLFIAGCRHSTGAMFGVALLLFSGFFGQSAGAQNSDEKLPDDAVLIEALVDGPSELRIKQDGIYWVNGGNAKPGRHEGREEPTYVNGKSWRPNWKEPRKDRGVDRTATKKVEGLDPAHVEFKLLTVGLFRDSPGIEKRDRFR